MAVKEKKKSTVTLYPDGKSLAALTVDSRESNSTETLKVIYTACKTLIIFLIDCGCSRFVYLSQTKRVCRSAEIYFI